MRNGTVQPFFLAVDRYSRTLTLRDGDVVPVRIGKNLPDGRVRIHIGNITLSAKMKMPLESAGKPTTEVKMQVNIRNGKVFLSPLLEPITDRVSLQTQTATGDTKIINAVIQTLTDLQLKITDTMLTGILNEIIKFFKNNPDMEKNQKNKKAVSFLETILVDKKIQLADRQKKRIIKYLGGDTEEEKDNSKEQTQTPAQNTENGNNRDTSDVQDILTIINQTSGSGNYSWFFVPFEKSYAAGMVAFLLDIKEKRCIKTVIRSVTGTPFVFKLEKNICRFYTGKGGNIAARKKTVQTLQELFNEHNLNIQAVYETDTSSTVKTIDVEA